MKTNDITLVIRSPRGNWTETFPKTTKVSELIELARVHFGFEAGDFTLKREKTGEILQPERPLVSYGIENQEVLSLVPEIGSGV